MAMSAPHFAALKHLAEQGEFKRGGKVLEIGECNWYGDMPIEELATELEEFDPIAAEFLRDENLKTRDWWEWKIVKVIYDALMHPSEIHSIDLDGTPAAQKLDLNYGQADHLCTREFSTSINHGTAEHVFNVAGVFFLMHEATEVGGLMIHESPFTGWIDHGFFTLQPTLFYDLAAANCYDIRMMAIEHIESRAIICVQEREHFHMMAKEGQIPYNSMLYVAMRKTNDAPLKIPQQGVYARNVSEKVQQAWRALR